MKSDNWKTTVKNDYINLWGIVAAYLCISVFIPISASFYLTILEMHNNLQENKEMACPFFYVSLHFCKIT